MQLNKLSFPIKEKTRLTAKIRMRENRANETQEERDARLQRMREYSASRRATQEKETSESRQAQKEHEAKMKREQRAKETPAQREARLQKMKDYRARIKSESVSQGRPAPIPDFRAYDRDQKRTQRALETPEEKEARLQKARDYKASRKAKSTPREKERTRERVAAFRAKRTDEEKKQDNEAAKLGMAKVRSNRTAPSWPCPKMHEEQCRVRKWRLLMAQGADAGPEPTVPNGRGVPCHRCDQDLAVPLAGDGRCPCYDCAVLHNKIDEWMKTKGKKYWK